MEPAAAVTRDRMSLFIRSKHIWVLVPDGPEYRVTVDSPDYDAYARDKVTDCARRPIVADRTDVGIYYKSAQGPQTGALRFELVVAPTGRVFAFQLLESPGGYALYSAIKSVRDWTFVPGETGDGKPTYCRFRYGINFVLGEG